MSCFTFLCCFYTQLVMYISWHCYCACCKYGCLAEAYDVFVRLRYFLILYCYVSLCATVCEQIILLLVVKISTQVCWCKNHWPLWVKRGQIFDKVV